MCIRIVINAAAQRREKKIAKTPIVSKPKHECAGVCMCDVRQCENRFFCFCIFLFSNCVCFAVLIFLVVHMDLLFSSSPSSLFFRSLYGEKFYSFLYACPTRYYSTHSAYYNAQRMIDKIVIFMGFRIYIALTHFFQFHDKKNLLLHRSK